MGFSAKLMLISTAIVLALSVNYAPFRVFGASEQEALIAITAAEERIILCYNAVAEADAVGADPSTLLATLNEAGRLLSLAEWSHAEGNYDSALGFASKSLNQLDGFAVEAEALAEAAAQEYYQNLVITFGGSIAGTGAAVIGGLGAWRLLNRRYGGRAQE